MTNYERIMSWSPQKISLFVIKLMLNTLNEFNGKSINLDEIREDILVKAYLEFLNQDEEENET